jgi:hypothetical protein
VAAIDIDDFANWCMQQSLLFGINPHYLVAVAKQQSGIDDAQNAGAFGPYALPQGDFDATMNDPEYGFNFSSGDISVWRIQSKVFALRAARMFDQLVAKLGRNPSAVELFLLEFPRADPVALATSVQKACNDTAKAIQDAAEDILDSPGPVTIVDPTKPAPGGPASADISGFNVAALPKGTAPIGKMIVEEFAKAGFGKLQQTAALANAIRESRLNPNAVSKPPEHSVGLFQLNMGKGLGMGHTEAQLKNPATNIAIIIREAKKFPAFASASTLLDAVGVFVRKVERPANTVAEINERLKIAQQLA